MMRYLIFKLRGGVTRCMRYLIFKAWGGVTKKMGKFEKRFQTSWG